MGDIGLHLGGGGGLSPPWDFNPSKLNFALYMHTCNFPKCLPMSFCPLGDSLNEPLRVILSY